MESKGMLKSEFAEHLKQKGYTVELEDGVVMVMDAPFSKISKEAKECGFHASYGVRHTKAKQGQIAASKSVECYEQMSLF